MIDDLLGVADSREQRVHLQRRFAASPTQVWAALTEPERLAGWLAPVVSGAPGPGATFVLSMAVGETATCTVGVWLPPRELVLGWTYTGEGESELRVSLDDDEAGGTVLTLDHLRAPAEATVSYAAGWHLHTDALAAHLSGTASRSPSEFLRAYDALVPQYTRAAEVAR